MHEQEPPTVPRELADILDSILGILGQKSCENSKADWNKHFKFNLFYALSKSLPLPARWIGIN